MYIYFLQTYCNVMYSQNKTLNGGEKLECISTVLISEKRDCKNLYCKKNLPFSRGN